MFSQFYLSFEVGENSVVDISSVKLVDKSSVLVKNTCLKLEELDGKAVVYQISFSPFTLLEIIPSHCVPPEKNN